MKILVVDDGQLAINSLIRILCRVAPDCDLYQCDDHRRCVDLVASGSDGCSFFES